MYKKRALLHKTCAHQKKKSTHEREPVYCGKSTQIKARRLKICCNRTVSLLHYQSCYHQGRPNNKIWWQNTLRLLQTGQHITALLLCRLAAYNHLSLFSCSSTCTTYFLLATTPSLTCWAQIFQYTCSIRRASLWNKNLSYTWKTVPPWLAQAAI